MPPQRACIACKDLPRAQRVFDDLVGAACGVRACSRRRLTADGADAGAVVPDEVLFSVLIRAHGAAAQPPWGDISALLGRMKHTWGIAPSNVTYSALLEICAATNDYERGCQARGWDALFVGVEKCGSRVVCCLRAQLIDRMLEEGVQPDAFTVAAVSGRKSLRSYLKRGL